MRKIRFCALLLCVAALCVVCACADLPSQAHPTPPDPTPTPFTVEITIVTPAPTPIPTPFSFVWISDTQIYAAKYPEAFDETARWIADNAAAHNLIAALHVGDVVDNREKPEQWENIAPGMAAIRGAMPLYVVAGNHDVWRPVFDYTEYLSHDFCDAREPELLYEGGQCWAQPIDAGGLKILLLGIGWQGEETPHFDWVETQMAAHSNHVVIILIHSFLLADGMPTGGGERLEALFAAHPNLRLLLCGHMYGEAKWRKSYPAGHTVTALLFNLQEEHRNGEGLGYLRILTIDPATGNLSVVTYSPVLDDYNFYDDDVDSFILEGIFR
ncbi:MAG: metallophosphoesterase [Clostridiales bacterium]|nr:metallophosphoesterase [Clostridiales bacterium]